MQGGNLQEVSHRQRLIARELGSGYKVNTTGCRAHIAFYQKASSNFAGYARFAFALLPQYGLSCFAFLPLEAVPSQRLAARAQGLRNGCETAKAKEGAGFLWGVQRTVDFSFVIFIFIWGVRTTGTAFAR